MAGFEVCLTTRYRNVKLCMVVVSKVYFIGSHDTILAGILASIFRPALCGCHLGCM